MPNSYVFFYLQSSSNLADTSRISNIRFRCIWLVLLHIFDELLASDIEAYIFMVCNFWLFALKSIPSKDRGWLQHSPYKSTKVDNYQLLTYNNLLYLIENERKIY